MKDYLAIGCAVLMMLAQACKEKPENRTVTDKDLTLLASRLKSAALENADLSFKVRIMPSSVTLSHAGKDINTNMQYHADSIFFIQLKGRKVYPGMIQPIANGVKGSFEYLILFEPGTTPVTDSLSLVYQDKYLNHKKYTIIF